MRLCDKGISSGNRGFRLEDSPRGLPVWKYAELLPLLSPPGRTLGVAGTHGKTTTSWLLYHALRGLPGPTPGALVGGLERALGTNAVAPEARHAQAVFMSLKVDRYALRELATNFSVKGTPGTAPCRSASAW